VFLSYYGGDLDELVIHEKGGLRRQLGVSDDSLIVGMVAYMYPPKRYLGQRRGLKGHEDLIDAMAVVQAVVPQAICVMVGSAPAGAEEYERQIRRYAERRAGSAIFAGYRSDVPMLYPDFDVAVHPSHSENLGGALESLLLGVPTVATDVGGFRDVVIPGRTGWLVPARHPNKLAEAIVDALLNPSQAKRFGAAGRSLALDLLDVRRTAAEVAQIYATILHRDTNALSSAEAGVYQGQS
jgi:glycosyltransferase involved in cell wall biosynthesis